MTIPGWGRKVLLLAIITVPHICVYLLAAENGRRRVRRNSSGGASHPGEAENLPKSDGSK